MEIKKEFFNNMKSILNNEDFEKFCESFNDLAKRGLVVNNLKIDIQNFIKNLEMPLVSLPYGEDCFILNSDEKVGDKILHHAGAFYMQEPSAMVAGKILPLKEGDIVLDICASPGGKTFQIAKRLENGIVFANEINFERAKVLQSNIERLGLNNVVVTNFSSKELTDFYINRFDAVLVDAPCSGEGMMRKEKKAVNQWTGSLTDDCVKMQREIIDNVDKLLKENGYIVYSTCTYSPKENEQMIKYIVDKGYEIQNIGGIEGSTPGLSIKGYNTHLAKRFYPHSSFGEGQFVCLLQKKKEAEQTIRFKPLTMLRTSEIKLVNEFISAYTTAEFAKLISNNLIVRDNVIYYCPNVKMVCADKKVVNYGVRMGEIVKNRFEPNHNLFTSFGRYFKTIIELDEKNCFHYLKGNTLNVSQPNGWCVVSYLGCCVGGGKIVNGVLKNHYPKGLRLF